MANISVDKNMMVPMRDGIRLATDVWHPTSTSSGPVILIRTPYSKDAPAIWAFGGGPNYFALLDSGYRLVWQDCRGTFNSEGKFRPWSDERNDGEDTLAWIAAQSWCDGNIGVTGPSYLGQTCWAAAASGSPHLRCIAPSVPSTDSHRAGWYQGGALSLSAVLFWGYMTGLSDAKRRVATEASLAASGKASDTDNSAVADLMTLGAAWLTYEQQLRRLPSGDHPELDKFQFWRDVVDHPDYDEMWIERAPTESLDKVKVPVLTVTGWFDHCTGETLRVFEAMKQRAGSQIAREQQRIIIGPWEHGAYEGSYPARQFGPMANAAAIEVHTTYQRFFDRWLRGKTDALEGVAPVRIFVMGADQWRDEQDWPLPDTVYTEFFLNSSSPANSASGGGQLSTQRAQAHREDVYLYDPHRPVPTAGGPHSPAAPAMGQSGPTDQRAVEARDDVLCYTTPVLDKAVEVTGKISLIVHFSSSAKDTDVCAKLVDVFPDGRVIYLTDGILRCRYRNSLHKPELMEPGKIYEMTVDLWATANVFLPGHRIRLEITSSNFPRFDRNTNTGGIIARESETDFITAVNRVHHGGKHASRLVLPLINR